ncbi:MAG TPA: hypothetical protein VJQ55_06755 [Candidatus Binatia bacterium]|nr:hypothetical protein [Candidatus Binatia bacterium]
MKVLLLVPRAAYDRLLAACENSTPEYQLLANGIVESDGSGTEQVKILCDSESVQSLLDFARQLSLDVFAAIRQIKNFDQSSSE